MPYKDPERKREADRLYYVTKGKEKRKPLTEAQKEKARERSRAWYAKNKERSFALSAEWRRRNPERRKFFVDRYDATHREEKNAKERIRYHSDPNRQSIRVRYRYKEKTTPAVEEILRRFEELDHSERFSYAETIMSVADKDPAIRGALRHYKVDDWLGAYYTFAA